MEEGMYAQVHPSSTANLMAERWALVAGMDCLALAACLLFPRLTYALQFLADD